MIISDSVFIHNLGEVKSASSSVQEGGNSHPP